MTPPSPRRGAGPSRHRGQPPDIRRALSAAIFTALALLFTAVPSDTYLARGDLLPWVALCTSLAVLLYGGPLTEGAHPQLTPLHSTFGAVTRRLATALVPWVALRLTDAIILSDPRPESDAAAVAAMAATAELHTLLLALAVIGLAWLSRDEGRTAWKPPGGTSWTVLQALIFGSWLVAHVVFSLAYVELYTCVLYPYVQVPLERAFHALITTPTLTTLHALLPGFAPPAGYTPATGAALLDAAFTQRELLLSGSIACGGFGGAALLWERGQNIRQRARAGRGATVIGRVLLVFVVPGAGIVLSRGFLDYAEVFEAYAISAWFLLAGSILWPRPTLRGYGVLLHGLEPKSLVQPDPSDGATPVTAPPKGTLRFNPARVRRTGLSIPWIVYRDQSAAAGIAGELDRLWPEWRARPDRHVLGAVTTWTLRDGRPLLDLSVREREDVSPLRDGDNQDRGLAVYHPADSPARRDALAEATWTWEKPATEARLVQLDPSMRSLRLGEASVLIFSTGYLTHLFEIEICDVFGPAEIGGLLHPPQLQDHVKP